MSSLCFSHCNSYGNENYYTFVTSLRQECINSELQIVKQINMTSSGSYKTFNSYIKEVLFTSKTAVAWSCDVTSVWWLVHPQTSWRRWKQSACVATREYRFLPGTRSCQKCIYGRFNEWCHPNEQKLRPRLWCTRIFATLMEADLGLVRTNFVGYHMTR